MIPKRLLVLGTIMLLPVFPVPCLLAGTNPAAFLNVGVGGRAMGLGGAFVSISDDATAMYWNPAGLGKVNSPSIVAMGQSAAASSWDTLKDVMPRYQFVGITFPVNTFRLPWVNNATNTFGIGFISSGLDGVAYTSLNESGVIVRDTFDDQENAYFISYGFPLGEADNPFSMGMTLKYITQQFSKITDARASGYDIDIGLIYSAGSLNLGLVMQRGIEMSWANGHKDTGPLVTKFGGANKFPLKGSFLNGSLSLLGSMDFIQRQGQPIFVNMGSELGYERPKSNKAIGFSGLFVRLGIDSLAIENRYGNINEINNHLNYTAGLGISMSILKYMMKLDYVFGSYRLGDKNRFSANFYF